MEVGVMNQRTGIIMMAVGGAIALVGFILLLTGGSDDATPNAEAAPATTALAETTATTTTSPAPTSTLAEPEATTTTTAPPAESIEEFLALFRQALETDDLEFLYNRLHPIVPDAFGEDVCRAFVEREISILENYVSTGPASDPTEQSIQGTAVDIISVPVMFDFQGQQFEATSTYAMVGDEVRYFAECR